MSSPLCQHLEDYLNRDLDAAGTGAFAEHLAYCTDCQTAVREQQRLERLLCEACAEDVPAGLLARVTPTVKVPAWRRGAVLAAGLTLAAAVLLAIGLGRRTPAPEPESEPTSVAGPLVPGSAPMPALPEVHVSFARARDLIVMPQSTNPRVTILWIYPTVQPDPPVVELERSRL